MFTNGSREYINLRLRLNASSLLAQSFEEFWELNEFFKILYKFRSNIVHGEDWSLLFEKYIKDKEINISEEIFTEKARDFRIKIVNYMNTSFMDLIEKTTKQDDIIMDIKEDPLYYFNNSEFINTNDNKKHVLEKIEKNYKSQNFKFSNKWEDFKNTFNI